jgi:hypothetical protein
MKAPIYEVGVPQVLTRDVSGCATSWIVIDKLESHFIEIRVLEQNSWSTESLDPVVDEFDESFELLFSGYLKWDGCSHIHFGDKESRYMHLCGSYHWVQTINALTATWNFVQTMSRDLPLLVNSFARYQEEWGKQIQYVTAKEVGSGS